MNSNQGREIAATGNRGTILEFYMQADSYQRQFKSLQPNNPIAFFQALGYLYCQPKHGNVVTSFNSLVNILNKENNIIIKFIKLNYFPFILSVAIFIILLGHCIHYLNNQG